MKRNHFPLIFLLLAGFASLGIEITHENNHVKMPHYAIVLPADKGWYLKRTDERLEAITATRQIGLFLLQIKLYRNLILNKEMQKQLAKTVADDFRKLEMQIMLEQGVYKDLYNLEILDMGEEVVANKTFYTMVYIITAESGIQRAVLYLYFPKPENNDAFIVAHYSETIPVKALPTEQTYISDFDRVLRTLSVYR